MEKTNEKALNDFLGSSKPKNTDEILDPDNKTSILDEREGLIERVDKVLVTRDGKQLLREQY